VNRPRSNRFVHATIALFLGLTTCASTPGHITGCSTGSAPGANAVGFCRDKETRICARIFAVDNDAAAHAECVSRIDGMCAGNSWPVGCAPTQATVNACLDALVDPARITDPPESLAECAAICGGSGGGIDPEGI